MHENRMFETHHMKRNTTLAVLVGALVIVIAACSTGPEPTATVAPTRTAAPTISPDLPPVIPADSEIDRKAAIKIGIDLHRQLWETRPSNNYRFGFQWVVADYAYQRANVQVRVIKGEVDEVLWADNAVKTDGTDPPGLEIPDMPNTEDYYNIEGLFAVISEAIESDPVRVSLGFDSIFGFPTAVSIEFATDNPHNNVAFFAAQLVPIAGPPE
jgi:hypothetical protein